MVGSSTARGSGVGVRELDLEDSGETTILRCRAVYLAGRTPMSENTELLLDVVVDGMLLLSCPERRVVDSRDWSGCSSPNGRSGEHA